MQPPARKMLSTGTLVFGLVVLVRTAGMVGATDVPLPAIPLAPTAPVTPTVLPPVPPTSPPVRFQRLIPQSGGNLQFEQNTLGNVKVEDPKPGDGNADAESNIFIETGPELTLGECISVAIERQPILKAALASQAASEAGTRALMNFGTVGTLLSPDLEVRKQQAQRGMAASAGEYQRAYNEIVQDVTRMYYTAVFAKQQEGIATDVVQQLKDLIEVARDILDTAKTPADLAGLNETKYLTMQIGLAEARQLQAKARIGRQQALAALRQAMAVEAATFPFRIRDTELPVMAQKADITKELVVEQALARRPELALAAAGVDVFRLEVYAQGKIPCRRVVPTFASGGDLHSRDIPQAQRGKDYRPGGIIPEMPTQLVGSKFDRICRAMAFSEKADAMFANVRSLVILEAENAYFEFKLAGDKLVFSKEKFKAGKELQQSSRENAENQKAKDQLVQAEIIAAKAQADYVEAVFEYLLALSALERVTAGGIRPAFPGR